MFPTKPPQDSPMEETGEPSGSACPYCGKEIQLTKAPGATPDAKIPSHKSNAAKMPMDQLKNVIKSGMNA